MSKNQPQPDIITLLEAVQTIARNGLHYTESVYDRERYQSLLDLCQQTYAPLLNWPEAQVQARLQAEFGTITPKIGADAAIFNDDGHILLMDRVDGTGWCLPCGWVDPNEKPCDTVIREVFEETGLHVEIDRFVGVFSRLASQENGPHSLVAVVHLCRIVGGELTLSHEGLALRYWPIADVPRWHGTHHQYARAAHTMWATNGQRAISN
ncbi:MAG TPA: NUDIX hydrolase N-terminal domain-containing protein [Anaerolineae bacterium]|nr:NUDIX hydrolase N-terminal domain-containing protein [Anaerolineae bacterium]